MANVAPIRKALGTRTIFNILGPLSNPAGARRQVIGVYDPKWLEPLAEVSGRLGGEKIWVVHGADGLDELSTTGVSHVAEWSDGRLTSFTIDANDYGLPRAKLEDLRGGDAIHNANALKTLAHGETGPYRDIVLLNAAAAILVGGKASTLEDGINQAVAAIDDGRAAKVLEDWAAYGSSDDRRKTT
jgi:anthranilate phosphoribosyltransferase